MKKKGTFSLLLVVAMLVSMFQVALPVAAAERTTGRVMETVDASLSNWTAHHLTGADATGGATFTGTAGVFGTGATLNTKVDVTEAVEFDLKFNEEAMAVDGHFAIVFGVDGESYANATKGASFIVCKMAENVIWCQQATTADWRVYTFTNTYTYRFEKGTDAWILYVKGAGAGQSDTEIGRIGFDVFAADGFANGKATFGVYLYDAKNVDNAVALEVTNVKNMTEQEETETPAEKVMQTVDASFSNWTVHHLTGADVTGGAAFTGTPGVFGTGATLNTRLDVTEAVEFDLKFNEEAMAVDGHFAIVFGVDGESYANAAKGASFIVGKMAENVIWCQQAATADWRVYTFTNTYTYRFEKGTDAWILYVKGAGADQSDLEIGRISFDVFAADGFANGKATFGVYLYDAKNADNTVALEVTNVKHMTAEQDDETSEEKVIMSPDVSSVNWTVNYLTGSDVTGGAAFTGTAGIFGTGATLNTKVEVKEAVEFDLKFTEEAMGIDGHYAIVFGVDENSYANAAKGTSFIVGKMAENVIWCQQSSVPDWREYTYTNTYTYRFEKGEDAWHLYVKNLVAGQSDTEIGRIGFDVFPADGFANGEATFGIYLFDSKNVDNTVAIEVTNIKYVHTCTSTFVSEKESSCNEMGNIAYWACKCGKYYADEACTEEISLDDTLLPLGTHNTIHFDAVAPGCHYIGNIEYWFCPVCEGFWTDEACTQLTNSKSVILPATGSENVVHVEAKAPTCKAEGNIEHWYCKDCEQFWQDEALTQLTNSHNVIIGKTNDHNAVKLPEVPAQVGKTGLTEGSQCSVCGTILKEQKETPALKLAAPKASKVTKATGGKKQITVKFKKVSGVTRYEIQIATKKNMKKGLKTVKVTKAKDMKAGKIVIKKLKAKKVYYVRIRTVKTVNGVTAKSSWSKVLKASKTK